MEGGQKIDLEISKEIDMITKESAEFILQQRLPFNISSVIKYTISIKIGTIGTTECSFVSTKCPLIGILSHFYNVDLFGYYKAEQVLIYGKK